ncbi:hypothetical protein EGR_07038 [Echinococcus granulosus]|uniref:Uncharacterized protein n=1 Tax=Echinococcus granulosus TaxID=6210 RepID=W6U9R9_ECHGR|nr:hypothetical protein EGR_07038 [Echinococcus granulosus]EUB58118.1 hypothetical protein EGR_07038 [Echinococcus granulosus]
MAAELEDQSLPFYGGHELAARLISSLQTHNCGATTSPAVTFDVRASSLPRDGSSGGGSGGGGQIASLLPSPWSAFPSNAFLAAAAAAAISTKTPTMMVNTSKCLQEAISMSTPSAADIHPIPEKLSDSRFGYHLSGHFYKSSQQKDHLPSLSKSFNRFYPNNSSDLSAKKKRRLRGLGVTPQSSSAKGTPAYCESLGIVTNSTNTAPPMASVSSADVHSFLSGHCVNAESVTLLVVAGGGEGGGDNTLACLTGAPSQLNRRNSRLGERGRRSRVVIHQIGDAEDHFSKALRNLHVKSAGEYEIPEGTKKQKRVWTLTSTFDDGRGPIEASVVSPTFESQNIADLAVEKHFEKSLATFHAKQAAAAAAAAASAIASTDEETSKTLLDLTQTTFSPSSPSTNSSSDGSALLSPREESGGSSFNPKKKWLAQYGDDEGAQIRVGRKGGTWSLDDNSWNSKNTTPSTNVEKRSRSCPLLRSECTHSVKTLSHCKHKCETNSNQDTTKPMELSQTVAAQSSISSLQLPQRGFLTLARTSSLEVPSLGNSIDFFDDEDEAVVASKSISARESPISSPIAASSGFFTDSTYSLDSSTLPVISEAGYFSSNASVSSSFKVRHLAVLRESATAARPKERSMCGCESEDIVERNGTSPNGRCWQLRKRTASDTSDISCLKRSRSVVDTGCGEHA